MNNHKVVINKVSGNQEALSNAVFLNLEIQGLDPNQEYFIEIGDKTHRIIHNGTLDNQTIQMNSVQRRENDRTQIDIQNLRDQIITLDEIEQMYRPVSIVTVSIKRVFASAKSDSFQSIPEINREDLCQQVHEQLYRIRYLNRRQSYLIGLTIGCDQIHCQVQTNTAIHSNYKFYPKLEHTRIDVVNEAEKNIVIREQNLFKFKDILDMGVGGLSSQFDEMFRRAFASRTLDPMLARSIGVEHIRGIMLYGPPGCGKTLIARQISRSMNSVEPIIINGPELMSKYVGESEENLRNVFAAAEKDYKFFGEQSNLHVIIFDEIDSICTHRGSNSGSTGVGDRIVNQLLTKLDGVNEINNILVIGLTNRLDLIDKALLRPGRFEVQIEIGLPDRQGRMEILNIHTHKLRKSECFDPKISIEELADLTANYTGAEIKGLVNSARSFALCRAIDDQTANNELRSSKSSKSTKSSKSSKSTKSRKSTKSEKESEVESDLRVMVTYADLLRAMREVVPVFGQDRIITGLESGLTSYGIYDFSPNFTQKYRETLNRLERFDLTRSNVAVITISGMKGAGKTTMALDIANQISYPMIRFIDQSKFVGMNDYTLSQRLSTEFEEVGNSERAVIVLDDLERLIGFSSSPRSVSIRENVMTSLITLIDRLEKLGANRKYVIIFTGNPAVIEYLTHPESNLIAPRAVKGSLTLPLVPVSQTNRADQTEYANEIEEIHRRVASLNGMKYVKCDHQEIFDPSTDVVPIKYYIEIYSDWLIDHSEPINDEEKFNE